MGKILEGRIFWTNGYLKEQPPVTHKVRKDCSPGFWELKYKQKAVGFICLVKTGVFWESSGIFDTYYNDIPVADVPVRLSADSCRRLARVCEESWAEWRGVSLLWDKKEITSHSGDLCEEEAATKGKLRGNTSLH